MNSGAVQEKSRSFAAVYRVAGHRLSHRASHEAWILEQLHHPRRYLFHRVHQEPAHHPGFDVGYRLSRRAVPLSRAECARRNAEVVLGRRPVERPAAVSHSPAQLRLAECHYEASVREHGALRLLHGRCGMVYPIDTHSLDPVHHRRIGRRNPRSRRQCEANESKSALSIVEDSSLRC